MFYKIATFTLFLIVCNAQEHLTCLRTDDVLTTPTRTPTKIQQGPPGKRGAVGAKGSIGEKGSKGEAGIPDNSLTKALENKINFLQQQVQQDKANLMKALHQGYKVIGNGWVTIFNGYQYKVTPGSQSWDASRSICRRWGGDLAVYGVQSMISRRIILRALSRSGWIWIGLSDKATEGRWRWVNNENVVQASALWSNGQPDDSKNGEDCGIFVTNNHYGYGTIDGNCGRYRPALCEKRLQ